MRVVSGIQPTGQLHLGNYLGAIRNWVRMQDEVAADGGDCFFFLADLHAITVHNDPKELAGNVRQMAAALIAAGIDPERSTLFNQAAVPAHAELAWLLAGTARIGWLNRMTQFKDKAGKNREGASVALFRKGAQVDKREGRDDLGSLVYQDYCLLVQARAGLFAQCGVWMAGPEPVGLGVREDTRPILGNTSRFVPHVIA